MAARTPDPCIAPPSRGMVRGAAPRQPLYCRTCDQTPPRVPLRDRRDARPDAHHLLRDPDVRGPTLPRRAELDGADPGAGPVRPGRQADAALRPVQPRRHRRLRAARRLVGGDAAHAVHQARDRPAGRRHRGQGRRSLGEWHEARRVVHVRPAAHHRDRGAGALDCARRSAVRDGRSPGGVGGLPFVRHDREGPRHRARLAALLAAVDVRDPAHAHLPGPGRERRREAEPRRSVTPLLVAAGALVAIGAAVATGARDARIASLGLAVMLAAAPFVADPLPGPLQLAFAVMAGILAGFLVFVAARRVPNRAGPPLGLPATLGAAAAGFAVGIGATAVALPRLGPATALAAGLAACAVAVGPIAITRDIFRRGSALIVLVGGAILLLTALAGTPEPLTGIATGVVLVALAGAVATVTGGAVAATGGTAIPDG